ncbi:hypothetical protein, partial [Thalassobaculum salexigens]|uniref:hypothetical protein n=1 Tax=Thalassobaculum salexigens TaxID=455360 RepID=UPI00248E7E54
MATIRLGYDNRGYLYLFGSAGRGRRRAQRVPNNDEELGRACLRQLEVEFAMGDLSWFERGKAATAPAPRAKADGQDFGEWAGRWLEARKPPAIEESTWRTYSGHVADLRRRLAGVTLDQLTRGSVQALRSDLLRAGKAERTADSRLGVLR